MVQLDITGELESVDNYVGYIYINSTTIQKPLSVLKSEKMELLESKYITAQKVDISIGGTVQGSYSLRGEDWTQFQLKAGGKPLATGNIFNFSGILFDFSDEEMVNLLQSLDQPYSVRNFNVRRTLVGNIENAATEEELNAILVDDTTFTTPPAQDLTIQYSRVN